MSRVNDPSWDGDPELERIDSIAAIQIDKIIEIVDEAKDQILQMLDACSYDKSTESPSIDIIMWLDDELKRR